MPPAKSPMPKDQRRAYHEAGHAVLAARFEIGIERVAIRRLPGKLTSSIYQSAMDYCPLRVGQVIAPLVDLRLEKYIDFLFGGSAADMLALEHYHGYSPEAQNRFREHWCKAIWSPPEIHLDWAYYYTTVWGFALLHEVWRWQLASWRSALSMVSQDHVWQAVEQVAQRLLAGEVLRQDDIAAALL